MTQRPLVGLAGAACLAADHTAAAQRFGAVEARREADGTREVPRVHTIADGDVAATRASLGDAAVAGAWAAGRAMTLEEASKLASGLALIPGSLAQPADAANGRLDADGGGLTRRERAVAALIVQGRTNRAIAQTLVLSERTVPTHVHNVLGKLGLTSRAQIAVWAIEHGLARSR